MNSSLTKTVKAIFRRVTAPLAALGCSACGGIQSSLNPDGPQATAISHIWWLMFSVMGVIYFIVIAALLMALKRRADGPTDDSSTAPLLNPPESGERTRRNAIIMASSITTAVLFVFVVASFSIGRSLTAELAHKNGVSIEITGHQWWWEVRYLDSSASNIFITANEIHIPVGVPVNLTLRASDVIHSFWVPNLSGKKDLIPGKLTTIWLQADYEGVYRGQCAEYCGLQHAHMAFWVIADNREQFNAWVQNQTQTSVQPSSDSQKKGQQVFLSSACVMCHSINGTPAGSNIGPNLTHIASRKTLAAATVANSRENLGEWILDSQHFKPGNKMPQNNLNAEDLQSLEDYLQSLK